MNTIDKILDFARERRSRKAIEQMGSALGAVVGDLAANFHRSLKSEETLKALIAVLATPAGQGILAKLASAAGISAPDCANWTDEKVGSAAAKRGFLLEWEPSEEEWFDLLKAIAHRYEKDERIFVAAARLIREADSRVQKGDAS